MSLDLGNIVTTLKQIFAIVSVVTGTIVCLKAFGIVIPVGGTIIDWSAVTCATALASK